MNKVGNKDKLKFGKGRGRKRCIFRFLSFFVSWFLLCDFFVFAQEKSVQPGYEERGILENQNLIQDIDADNLLDNAVVPLGEKNLIGIEERIVSPEAFQQGEAGGPVIPGEGGNTGSNAGDDPAVIELKEEEKISLDLKGIDVVELLRILSLKMGITIVPTKSVSGRVNIFLNNLTFDDALEVILLSQDLACEKKENLINIMTAAEYEKLYGKKYNEKRDFESLKLIYAKPAAIFNALSQIRSEIGKVVVDESSGTIFLIDIPEKLELMKNTIKDMDQPPVTEIFDLKYSKPEDMKTHLSGVLTSGVGEIYVDERSSKVLVSDLPEKMKRIKRMMKAFDEANQQVFIEAEILQVTLKDEYQRGMNWEKVFNEKHFDDLDITGGFPVDKAISFTPSPAAADAALKLVVGKLARDGYTSTLQFIRTFGDAKILSRPRIAVINNQEAKILVGSREAYVTQSQSQSGDTLVTSESVDFIDVGVKLNVVPTINKENYVSIKIKPEVSSVRETLTTSGGSRVPIVETSEAETTVTVKDGMMIMIAGLMKEDRRKDIAGIPFLSRIPVFGSLFGSRASLNKKTEIIVFLTPHIITGDVAVKGMGAREIIPPDIMPLDMAKSIFLDKVKEIKVNRNGGNHSLDTERSDNSESRFSIPVEQKKAVSIEDKIKGIKEY